ERNICRARILSVAAGHIKEKPNLGFGNIVSFLGLFRCFKADAAAEHFNHLFQASISTICFKRLLQPAGASNWFDQLVHLSVSTSWFI
ncbi:MAG: hypothetical protein LBT62_07250, partial [Deltaproteobacteria bacterium]|nr:hypothetical protein [Deltaproteobacteria bacterium]